MTDREKDLSELSDDELLDLWKQGKLKVVEASPELKQKFWDACERIENDPEVQARLQAAWDRRQGGR